MGLFSRLRTQAEPPWAPPLPGMCACEEHVENFGDHTIPFAANMEEPGAMSVVDLLDCGALDTKLTDPEDRYRTLVHSGQRVGPFQWNLWLGDEGRALYDDDAPASLDDVLSLQPGIVRVSWEDREVFLVGAPTLCASGVSAAMVRALDNPRVRLPRAE
ncbi:MAG: hypothetical protein WBQ50_17925 [Nocardioides sp.]